MNKYRARKTEVDGIVFDSAKEARRYGQLKLMLKAGVIAELERQRPYELTVNGVKVATYRADFVYRENGAPVVEDVKGFRTPEYKLKAKLMRAVHGITIKEV